ncbi:MAG TPA: hypothetical protein ENK01_01330 [Hellea balneolensis]|uniref:Peptidase A2 domain-containing protein n=1 Tax=Hellea balneolensis TaxID=287478 RepID=A0A7V5NWH5_9PROT|nr:hypothetical protein [Hellea balneolensis]
MFRTWSLKTFLSGIRLFLGLCLTCFSTAFASTDQPEPFGQTVPFENLPGGQYAIDLQINGQGPFKFMIDSAATRTAIFTRTLKKLHLQTNQGAPAFINGMTSSRYRPSARVKEISFAGHSFLNHDIIILQDRKDMENVKFDGILGIDLMAEMTFWFNHQNQNVSILKNASLPRTKLRHWKKLNLKRTPYSGKDYGLYFIRTRIAGRWVPTMLDTGANFTAMNWKSVKGTVIENELRRLREDWVVNGSVGVFKPRQTVLIKTIKIDKIHLKNHYFLIMNFDNLPVNHYGKYPLIIAGMDILGGRDFILDFPKRRLFIAPPKQSQ